MLYLIILINLHLIIVWLNQKYMNTITKIITNLSYVNITISLMYFEYYIVSVILTFMFTLLKMKVISDKRKGDKNDKTNT